MDSYDLPGGDPLIFLNVKHTHVDYPKSSDELLSLFSEAVRGTRFPLNVKDIDEALLKSELHTSYLACFHALRALDTRRVREVAARFLICTNWVKEDPSSYHEIWGLVRVHL